MKTKLLKLFLLAPALLLVGNGCDVYVRQPRAEVVATAPDEVVVGEAPPAALVEVVPAQPAPDFVWIGGAWIWGPGGHWVWDKGRWERPPHPGARWVPHSYAVRNGRRVFVRGGWR